MRLNASNKVVPLAIHVEWNRINLNQPNPLNLDEGVISDSEKHAPPLVFEGGTWLGRVHFKGLHERITTTNGNSFRR